MQSCKAASLMTDKELSRGPIQLHTFGGGGGLAGGQAGAGLFLNSFSLRAEDAEAKGRPFFRGPRLLRCLAELLASSKLNSGFQVSISVLKHSADMAGFSHSKLCYSDSCA